MQVILSKVLYRRISRNLWISTLLITIFGGLTVFFHNKTFIFIKPTALYWLIALTIIISQLIGKNIIKSTLQKEVKLAEIDWRTLGYAWSLFFIALGGLNLFVAFYFSEYTWVRFKVFGTLGLLIAFTILSGGFIYLKDKKQR
jgi:intracellular septation protein